MIRRELDLPPTDVYPPDPWRLVETRFFPDRLAQFETLFALSNGFLGVRGAHEEGSPAHHRATLINGFHETWPITYAEPAFGFARTGQTIVSVADAFIIRLLVDDEPLYLPTAHLLEYERALDMREGVLMRDLLWRTPSGKDIRVRSRRLVSLEHRHLSAIDYEVCVENADASIDIVSEIDMPAETAEAGDGEEHEDPRLFRGFSGRVLFPERAHAAGRRISLSHKTGRSGMTVACAIDHAVETENTLVEDLSHNDDHGRIVFSSEAKKGRPIRLFKAITHQTSHRAPAHELDERADRSLDRALRLGFESLLDSQRERLTAFWGAGDVEIRGRESMEMDVERIQQVVRLNLFHIHQASARAEGAGIPAKGLTGRGYEGHYFWDIEIYVLPFLIYTEPRLARNLLEFRLEFLDLARARAQQVNQKGALFPWRTINGEEASAYYAAGTAQYHINADIMHAIRKYVEATGDDSLLDGPGIEALVETARLWRDLGFFSGRRDRQFCIAGVTGPDEYNTVVNNNFYTNLMARENMWWAAQQVERLREADPKAYTALVRRLRLERTEVDEWRRAADAMRLPFDEGQGIHLQDDEFLDKKPWDFENVPASHYPLLLRYHPLVIYRSMVIKQADVVLAMFLLGEEFSLEQKRRNFAFYDPLTTGDSSLSVSIQAIIAAEVGDMDTAREYARYAGLMDFADIGRNVKDGVHLASMGGTWMALVHGFGGFRDHRGRFSFQPRVPSEVDCLRFRLLLAGARIEVDLSPVWARYRLIEGDSITFHHDHREVTLTRDQPEARRKIESGSHEPEP
jgi:alpha,alpha-trehalose phosphorylase